MSFSICRFATKTRKLFINHVFNIKTSCRYTRRTPLFLTINTHSLLPPPIHNKKKVPFSLSSSLSAHFSTQKILLVKMTYFASILKLFLVISLLNSCFSSRIIGRTLVQDDTQYNLLQYHKGPLLSGKISINLIWYGQFKPSQRAIISDFISSLSTTTSVQSQPSVASWWKQIENYYHLANSKNPSSLSFYLGQQILDENYFLGKSLTLQNIVQLASKGQQKNAINVVLTADDVTVDGFCQNSCGSHGSSKGAVVSKGNKNYYSKLAYIWVGNSATQCPGYCAWPFHQPQYGPQNPPLIPPNNDVGLDGMVINLGGLLAGAATNPFGNGYYQGPAEAPLEAASACPGVYAKGAYPGYAGNLLVDPTTGASYNAHGTNGRKFVLPAIYDLSTTTCSTLV